MQNELYAVATRTSAYLTICIEAITCGYPGRINSAICYIMNQGAAGRCWIDKFRRIFYQAVCGETASKVLHFS